MTLYNTTDAADKIGTDPKTLRKFLRSPEGFDAKVGKGSRWSIEARDMRSLKTRFARWAAAQDAARAERLAARDAEVEAPEAEAEVDDSLDSLEGPTDEDLADIDA